MERKEFIKLASMATMACSINGLPIHAFGEDRNGNKKTRNFGGKTLILIRLNGGNDGLNTLVPLDQYSALTTARSNVLLPSASVLPLNGSTVTGLHPSMTHMQSLYNNGKLNIIQGVSYPNPNYSHFRATDIFASASDSSLYINSGWIGRFIENQFPGAPNAYPNASFTDPLSIEIGYQASSLIYGNNGLNGMTISNIDYFYNIQNNIVDPAPPTKGGNELTYVRFVAQQTQSYTSRIETATNLGTNSVTYPSNSNLADQLKIVAKLISGGLQTPVFIVNQDGYDTHNNQVEASNHTQGEHADLLAELSAAIGAFQQDLENQNLNQNVVGMTFSEFGRRIKSNGSNGTDHGTAEPVFVFGTEVNPTMIGTNPVLPSSPTVDDDVPMQFDFRQIYATVLTDWFGVSPSNTQSIMNGNTYAWLPIFTPNTPLPLGISDPELRVIGCEVELEWSVVSDEFVSEYEIHFSKEGKEFVSVGRVAVGSGKNTYTFRHQPNTDIGYYKLKILQKDGLELFSKVLTARLDCSTVQVHVYPNPADTYLHIDVKGSSSSQSINLIDLNGAIVKYAMNDNGNTILSVQDLPNGVYSLVLRDGKGHKEFHKVIVKHNS
jgi:uncharacterized protein (DUF1501 family)